LEPRSSGSNPAEDGGFLRAIKVRSMHSFGGEVKPQFRKILQHVTLPVEYDRDTTSAKLKNISRKIPASLLNVSAAVRALEDESGIKLRCGLTVDQKMVAVHGNLCTIPRRNTNSNLNSAFGNTTKTSVQTRYVVVFQWKF
jgi:hypothetical protein